MLIPIVKKINKKWHHSVPMTCSITSLKACWVNLKANLILFGFKSAKLKLHNAKCDVFFSCGKLLTCWHQWLDFWISYLSRDNMKINRNRRFEMLFHALAVYQYEVPVLIRKIETQNILLIIAKLGTPLYCTSLLFFFHVQMKSWRLVRALNEIQQMTPPGEHAVNFNRLTQAACHCNL